MSRHNKWPQLFKHLFARKKREYLDHYGHNRTVYRSTNISYSRMPDLSPEKRLERRKFRAKIRKRIAKGYYARRGIMPPVLDEL